jgi:hypothetical protein
MAEEDDGTVTQLMFRPINGPHERVSQHQLSLLVKLRYLDCSSIALEYRFEIFIFVLF